MPTTQHITRAFQWDLARQVERLDFLLQSLPRYAEWGYEELYLHLEDAVEYPSLAGVARSDAYSYRQFARLVEAATAAGIRVVPIVNLLGHTQYLIKMPELRELNELRDDDGSSARRADRSARCIRARWRSPGSFCATWRRSARPARCTLASTNRFISANVPVAGRTLNVAGSRPTLPDMWDSCIG